MADNKALVLKAMKKAGQPLKAGEVAKLAGLSDKDTSKLIKELQAEGKVASPKRCYYEPAGR